MEFTLLGAALSGIAALWLGLRIDRLTGEFDRLIGAAVIGILAGRLLAMGVAGVNPLTNPGDILIVRGGVSPVGATLGAIAYLGWSSRHDLRLLDRVAPAAMLGMAGWHAGCLWRGSCLGTAADIPWGWALPGSAVTRHPVELYAAGLLVIGALLLRRLPSGSGSAGLALTGVAAARLLTQPLRPSLDGGPTEWYWVAMLAGLAGYWLLRRRGDGGDAVPDPPPAGRRGRSAHGRERR